MSACVGQNRYIFKILSVVYFIPVSYDTTENRFVVRRSNCVSLAIGLLLSVAYIYHDYFFVLVSYNVNNSAFTLAVFILEITVFAFVPLLAVCNSFIHRKRILQLLNVLFTDEAVLDVGRGQGAVKSLQFFAITARYLKVLYTFMALLFACSLLNRKSFSYMLLEVTLVSRFLLALQYLYLYYLCVGMVRLRMKQLKLLLLEHRQRGDGFDQVWGLFVERFQRYAAQIGPIGRCLSVPMLSMLLQACIELAYFAYECFRVLNTGEILDVNYNNVPHWFITQCWQLLHCNALLLIVPICEQASNEVEETALCTRHFDDYRLQNTRAAKQIQKFLLKNLHQKKKFSACGFFDIDNTVIYMVFSSIVTYLVILIQFKQLETDLTQSPGSFNVTNNGTTVDP
uniref:Gustatory receptor n=1 Tax=Anopheles epiroticus TaxID=199890 RepID=A0A182P334_9DIPT